MRAQAALQVELLLSHREASMLNLALGTADYERYPEARKAAAAIASVLEAWDDEYVTSLLNLSEPDDGENDER